MATALASAHLAGIQQREVGGTQHHQRSAAAGVNELAVRGGHRHLRRHGETGDNTSFQTPAAELGLARPTNATECTPSLSFSGHLA